jgi:hypothetical protein
MSDLRVFLRSHGVPVKQSDTGMRIFVSVRAGVTVAQVEFGAAEVYTTGTTGFVMGTAAFAAGLLSLAATAVGGWIALGSGYYGARRNWRNENLLNGFVYGFVTSLLGWSGRQVAEHFGKWNVIRQNAFDGQMDVIERNSYDEGLKKGFVLADGLSENDRKDFLREIRHSAHVPVPSRDEWTDNERVQDNYVDALALVMRLCFIGSGDLTLK